MFAAIYRKRQKALKKFLLLYSPTDILELFIIGTEIFALVAIACGAQFE